MAKNKTTKTYSVFVTIEGVIGMAAGLEMCSNASVKEADKMALLGHGYKQVGSVFTRSGRLSLDQLKEMVKKGEAETLDRVHVSTFISMRDEYERRAAESIERMKRSIREKAEREARERAELERRKTAKKLIEVYSYEYECPDSEHEVQGTFETLDEAWEYVKEHYSADESGRTEAEFFPRNDEREWAHMVLMYYMGYYGEIVCYQTIYV